jgi:hypothetical protein
VARPVARPKGEPLPTPPDWHWPLADVAKRHGLSVDALVRASRRRELVIQRSGRAYRVSDPEYRRWLAATGSSFFSGK